MLSGYAWAPGVEASAGRPGRMPARTSPTVRITRRTSRGARPDVGHALARGEAQALRTGAGVADHERGEHGRGREDDRAREAGVHGTPDDADVDDALAPPVEGGVEEAADACETRLVARASAPSNRSKTPPKITRSPAASQAWSPAAIAATTAMRKPMTVSAFGVKPEPAEPDRDRGHQAPDPRPELGRDERAAHWPCLPRVGPVSRPSARDWRAPKVVERLRHDGVHRPPAHAARADEADLAQL